MMMSSAIRRTLAAAVLLAGMTATTMSGKTGISVDLAITKTDSPDPVTAGNNLTYTITVVNNNTTTAAAGGEMDDTLPTGTTFVSLSAAAGWSCTSPSVGSTGSVQCTNATVAASANAVFTLVVNVASSLPGGTSISNTATITSQTLDPTPGNNSSTSSTQVNNVESLTITKTDSPDPVAAGANLTYTITINSIGPSDTGPAGLSDPLPAITTFVSLTSPLGWITSTPAIGANGTVTASLAAGMPAGTSAVFTLVVHVPENVVAGTTLSNTAEASWQGIPAPALHGLQGLAVPIVSATSTTTVSNTSDVTITKIDTPDPVTPGSNLTYTITVTNNGPSDSGATTLTDSVPANTTFFSLTSPAGWVVSTPAIGGTGTITANRSSLLAGSSHVFTLVVNVPSATPVGTTLSNTATVGWVPTAPAGLRRGPSATTTPTSAIATTTVAAAVPAMPRQMLFLLFAAMVVASLWLLRRRRTA